MHTRRRIAGALAVIGLLAGLWACRDVTDATPPAPPMSVAATGGGVVLAQTTVNGLTITLQQLPDYPGAAAGQAYSINNAGTIVGSAVIAPGWNERPLMWPAGGAPIDLGTPAGIPYAAARSISDSGHIGGATGVFQTSLGTPIMFRPGAPVTLPTLVPPTGVSFVWSVNNHGDAAGSARNYTYPRRFEAGVRWVNGQIEDLGLAPGMVYTNAYGINDAGDVVGTTGNAFLVGSTSAFVWRRGSFTLLPTPGCSGGTNIAYFIHNNDDIVGTGCGAGGAPHATLWRNGQAVDLTAGDTAWSNTITTAMAVNGNGWAVGYSGTAFYTPLLFAGGQVIPLPQPPLAVPQQTIAYSINDHGQIVGGGYVDATFITKPLLWTVTGTPGGNRAPVASITTASQGFEGLPIAFDGSQSFDPDGDPLTYAWTFGDGGTATGKSVSHTYVDNGTYTAVLTVTDPAGLTGSAAATVTVFNSQPSIGLRPLGRVILAVGGTLSLKVGIRDAGVNDSPWTCQVDWGDGTTTPGQRTTQGGFTLKHVYSRAGSFTVSATVTDKDGMTGWGTGPLVVVR